MKTFWSRFALMAGNFAVGISVLGPAGMLRELADGLQVGIHDAGLLVTFGAVILCVGSPVMVWLTTRIDRRLLLAGTLSVIALGEAASALAPTYAFVLAVRLIMLVVAAIYTPQAASTVSLIVPGRDRASAISFVFLGWSIAVAGGLPLVTFFATHFGWRMTYGIFAAISLSIAALLMLVVPKGLRGHPLSLQSFADIARNRPIVLMLLLTLLHTSGQFTVFIYLAPLLEKLTGAGPAVAGSYFAMLGVAGFVGNVIATSIVTSLGTLRTLALFLGAILSGLTLWSLGAGLLPVMGAGVVIWGLGFAASNSMQQARLVAAAPPLASASVALNTSVLYVGQAVGSGVGGLLYASGAFWAVGYIAMVFVAAACSVLAATWNGKT